ncbi:MAG: DUF2066 domain-containing protein [Gammaproteobacteria bacterium]|nr:DUF2066 domain-containing protein [Gammaproteobacteria bacterium]
MPSRWLPFLALFAGLLASSPVPAVEVYGLYEAEVAVADKSVAARNQALGRLLMTVATKVSGQRDLGGNAVLREAAGRPAAYVQQFRYRAVQANAHEGEGSVAGSRLTLRARFDVRAVEELLTRAGLPVWGRIRPSVLVWLAAERGDERELLGADDAGRLVSVLERTSAQRGLPLVLPLLDLEDRTQLSVSDVWAGFDEAVLKASQRYQSKTVLVGRVYQTLSTLWEARWRLYLDDTVREWGTQGAALELALEEGVHEAADALAARLATRRTDSGLADVALAVSGIRTLEDYARTLRYLRSLDAVDAVRVTHVEGDSVSFRLLARGGESALEQVVSFSRTLEREQVAEEESGLAFRLLP